MDSSLFRLTSFGIAASLSTAAYAVNADQIWFGGPIVTVNDKAPNAEAVAVKDGKIVAVGKKAAVLKAERGPRTVLHDLKGQTMIPGFIDPHSHFIDSLSMADRANISAPPVGKANNPAEIIAELKSFAAGRQIKPGELIAGWGYDENTMPEGDLLTRSKLDEAFPSNPVVVIHTSMHGAVINSKAMEKYGLKDGMETPPGGVIVRRPGTQELDGLVMEAAYLPVFAALPTPTPQTEVEAAKKGQMIYAATGITTAQEGATHAPQLELLQRVARQGGLFIDVVAYPFVTDLDAVLKANPPSTWGKYDHHLKIGGCKMTIDGSPQAKTAWFTTPYLTGGPNGEKNWTGGKSLPDDVMMKGIKTCYANGLQQLIHANGDAAVDYLIKLHETAAAGDLTRDRRTVCIHCQFVRPDQLVKLKEYKIIPALFTQHTYFFYDVHVVNRGTEQAGTIAPIKSAMTMGMRPTNHTDYAVTPIDQMFTMWTAVNRISRKGVPNSQEQRLTPYEALKTMTINAAYQYREEASKGSIERGKRADLAILSANPLTVAPDTIKDIKVLETIKDGKSIYRAAN